MSNLSWGKPRIFVKDLDATSPEGKKWRELNTPVENSTELQPTKGDKLEAKVEGGASEDVKYKGATYAVVYNIRKAKDRKPPFAAKDGVAGHHYAMALMPEDDTNIGFYVERSSVVIDDPFTAADGAIWAVQHDAIAPAAGNTVKWGTVSVDEGKLKFTETQPAEDAEATQFEEDVTLLSAEA